jgi:hypothetical protein
MVEVQTSEVDAKASSVSLGLSRVKSDNHCWATEESIVKEKVLLLEFTVEQVGEKCETIGPKAFFEIHLCTNMVLNRISVRLA